MTHNKKIAILETWPKKVKHKNHGYSDSATYKVWQGITKRCYNKNASNYYLYGGKGVRIAAAWREFEQFLQDMGARPSAKHSIERIDHRGNYTPDNCKWATIKEQARNKGNNRIIEINGEKKCLAEWIESLGVSPSTIRDRIYKLGWSEERAITTPVAKRVWKAKVF